jgi:broad specificity phosphatase PhoE
MYRLRDARYARLPREEIPPTESLKDTVERVLPYWDQTIVPAVRAGERVLIVSHGNSLRALGKDLDKVSDDAITEPTSEAAVRSRLRRSTVEKAEDSRSRVAEPDPEHPKHEQCRQHQGNQNADLCA